MLWITLVVGLLIAAFMGAIFYELYCSKEFHAARFVCHEYATHKGFSPDWTCMRASKGWTKQGNYDLSCFLFFPDDKHAPYLILVRYTNKCPTNTFEAGTIPNSFTRSCTADTVIHDAEFIRPP
jgi:hypothetical protein